jgi:hypothetical protein
MRRTFKLFLGNTMRLIRLLNFFLLMAQTVAVFGKPPARQLVIVHVTILTWTLAKRSLTGM